MKNLVKVIGLFSFCVVAQGVVVQEDAFAASKGKAKKAFADVCPKVQQVGSGSATIYKNSAPVRANSNITAPIIGFRREPTLIMGRNISTRGTKPIYDNKGNTLGSCPWATAHDFAGGRFRCTMQTASLRRAAVRNTNNPAVFFKVNSNTCIQVPDAGKCYGSSKGLCNQTLK